MASALALVAALLFAVAAALQQKGALNLPEISLKDPSSLVRLAAQTMWLAGTAALLVGYVFQAAALDRGRLSIIQPLLVTTVVFALPLGYFVTAQRVGGREVVGATVIVLGLALFAIYGDPAGGRESAPGAQWAIAFVVLGGISGVLLAVGGNRSTTSRAATYVVGVLLGTLLLEERLSRPAWHVLVACVGLALALIGAVVIAVVHEARAEPTGDVATVAV